MSGKGCGKGRAGAALVVIASLRMFPSFACYLRPKLCFVLCSGVGVRVCVCVCTCIVCARNCVDLNSVAAAAVPYCWHCWPENRRRASAA